MKGGENELNDFLTSYRDEFNKLPPETIAFPRSCNGLKKFASDSSIYETNTYPCQGCVSLQSPFKEKGLVHKFKV